MSGQTALLALPHRRTKLAPGGRRLAAVQTIARQYGNAPEQIAFAILAPHPRMNVTFSRRDAQDIAAYIATLGK
jgi:hypothetical protein